MEGEGIGLLIVARRRSRRRNTTFGKHNRESSGLQQVLFMLVPVLDVMAVSFDEDGVCVLEIKHLMVLGSGF